MKRIGILAIVLLLVATGVYASVDVDVDCSKGWLNSDICREHELQDEFDTMTDYVNDNEEIWAKDNVGGGISTNGMWKALVGDLNIKSSYDTFMDYLNTVFVTKAEIEAYNDRLDMIECRIINGYDVSEYDLRFCEALMKSKRTNQIVDIEGWHCDSTLGQCVQIIKVVDSLD